MQLLDDLTGRPVVGAHRSRRPPLVGHPFVVEPVAEPGCHDPVITVPGDCPANESLGQAVAVALRRIDEVDAQVRWRARGGYRPRTGEALAPLTAELPCDKAH